MLGPFGYSLRHLLANYFGGINNEIFWIASANQCEVPMTTSHRIVNPESLPKPIGFSHAIVAAPGRTVYLGGQAALEADGFTVIPGGLAEQFDRSLYFIVQALEAAGGKPEDLVAMQVFVTDVADYRANRRNIGKIWQERIGHHYPAMTLLQVTGLLYPELLVELLATAVIPE